MQSRLVINARNNVAAAPAITQAPNVAHYRIVLRKYLQRALTLQQRYAALVALQALRN